MSSCNGHGFREVIIDQPFAGQWMEVDMHMGGGHSTFQGTKFSDFAGGFSYKNGLDGKTVVQNRCIYWRTLNDKLELTEISMDYNLVDNQVRYIFQDSPIVGPVAIQETETSVIILVATVTSVNRFVFCHPKRIQEMSSERNATGTYKPSIFHQMCNKPQMTFKSINLYEHAINIPVPVSAACYYLERPPIYNQSFKLSSPVEGNGECVFAFSFENGSIHIYKICRNESLEMYDLRQANIFARFLSGFAPSILRGPSATTDAVIGLSFFAAKGERNNSVELVALSMNGQLRLWHCNNIDIITEWVPFHYGVVDKRFAIGSATTDSSMLLRKNQDQDSDELPFFVIFLPGDGFKVYKVHKSMSPVGLGAGGASPASQYELQETQTVVFKDRDLMDFSLTSEYIFVLVSNPEEETEWEIKSCKLNENLEPKFDLALLEPLPYPDVPTYPASFEPKEFYIDLVFNKSSFSSQTIIKALTMFRKDGDEIIKDKDWVSLRITAMNMIDREIGMTLSDSEFGVADNEYSEWSLKYWLMFYNSCVEYHIHTIKPLGLFYESNTRMVCIVKKSRISFLRPTDFMETMYYFPHCIPNTDPIDLGDDRKVQLSMILWYMEAVNIIESTLDQNQRYKLDKVLRNDHSRLEDTCTQICTLLSEADEFSLCLEQRHFLPMLASKLKELGELGNRAFKLVIGLIVNWDGEGDRLNPQEEDEMDLSVPTVTESFMGSRLGAHLAFKILTQIIQHRFMLARDTMILQSLIVNCFSQNSEYEGVEIIASMDDRLYSLGATTNYFALLQLTEDPMEYVDPSLKERGIKIANILKISTADHLKSERFLDPLWPMKVVESFCASRIGGLAIRSRVSSSKHSRILAYAEAAGRAIFTSDSDASIADHPFEDFLISSCQYSSLLKYANYIVTYFNGMKTPTKKFYLGLANLCLEEPDTALASFRSIPLREAADDSHFCMKILELPWNRTESNECTTAAQSSYYVKVIKVFQLFELIPAILKLAEDGLSVAQDDDAATKMCSLAFKSAMRLQDYTAAFRYILTMPSYDVRDRKKERKEKFASLRMFVSELLQRMEVQVLTDLDLNGMFNKTSTVREQVEDILFSQANLSDPTRKDGVYQVLYLYHLCRENYHKAGTTMYYRAMRIGEKGSGLLALEAQRESYLDVITCLRLVEMKEYRFVIQKTGLEPEKRQPETCFDGSVMPVLNDEPAMVVRTYDDVLKELELCVMLLKIADKLPPSPIKVFQFPRRAEQAVECLTVNHFYDDAIKLAQLWGISTVPIISCFTDVCTNLFYNILPESNDPAEYIRNNDVSELPNSNVGIIDTSFRLLQSYLAKLEKPKESTLHEMITLTFLAADIELPQWLISSYKKRNVAQLIKCYTRYGDWEEATELTVKVLDASLGDRNVEEFDPTIRKINTYDPVEPVIPFTAINVLLNQIKVRIPREPELQKLYDLLKERTSKFCNRVLECTKERKMMFAQ